MITFTIVAGTKYFGNTEKGCLVYPEELKWLPERDDD